MNPPRQSRQAHVLTAWTVVVVAFSVGCRPTLGFTISAPFSSSSSSSSFARRPMQALHMSARPHPTPLIKRSVSTRTKHKKFSPPPKRLSDKEQKRLLFQVYEYRRLTKLETDLALQNADNAMPLLLIRSQEAGYGTDLIAYEQAMEDGRRARESLLTHNMGLVHYCVSDIVGGAAAKKRRLNSLSRDDLVQEGAIGLARAVDKFNPGLGTQFSTYAVYWIRAAILRCIAERDDMLRVPQHVSDTVFKVTRAAQKLGLELDGDEIMSNLQGDNQGDAWKEASLAKALALEAGLTPKQLARALQVRQRRNTGGYTSFEPWMQPKKEFLVDGSSNDAAATSPDVEQMKTLLSTFLRPKEMEALSWRYGLNQEQQQQQQATHSPPASPRPFRDYLAEAEEDLFGPQGILTTQEQQQPATTTKQTAVVAVVPTKGKWGEAMSFNEVGKAMSVSAEYGRRLCNTALSKLQAAAKEGKLEPAFLF